MDRANFLIQLEHDLQKKFNCLSFNDGYSLQHCMNVSKIEVTYKFFVGLQLASKKSFQAIYNLQIVILNFFFYYKDNFFQFWIP